MVQTLGRVISRFRLSKQRQAYRTINASYDTAFKNITIEDSLPFLHIGDGVYLFEEVAETVLRNFSGSMEGFGNEPEGYNHNYSFTMELHSYFTYRQGLRFEFLR